MRARVCADACVACVRVLRVCVCMFNFLVIGKIDVCAYVCVCFEVLLFLIIFSHYHSMLMLHYNRNYV